MASIRTTIANRLVEILTDISVSNGYATDVQDVQRRLRFIDEIEYFPSIYLVGASEARQYLPSFQEERNIIFVIRAYIRDDDSDAAINDLIDDIENAIRADFVATRLNSLVTDIRITEITTDEGLLAPEGVAEIIVAATLFQ